MTFYERLESLCQESGVEMAQLGGFIGIKTLNRSTINRWASGVMPRNATLKAIADAFKVDVAYLLGKDAPSDLSRHTEEDCAGCPCRETCKCQLSEQEHELVRLFRSTSELGKMRLIKEMMLVWEQDQSN